MHPPHGEPEDPNKATLLHILRILNRAEDEYQDEEAKGLELSEIQYQCQDHWAVKTAGIQPNDLLNVLVQNGMVDHVQKEIYSWIRQRTIREFYCITEPGKAYLVKSETDEGRVS
jgi:hypothetical protein